MTDTKAVDISPAAIEASMVDLATIHPDYLRGDGSEYSEATALRIARDRLRLLHERRVELERTLTEAEDALVFWRKHQLAALDASRTPPADLVERDRETAQLWQELLDKDDRTSPAEYPDMALITFEEFADLTSSRAAPAPVPEGWRPIETAPADRPVQVCWLDEGEYERIEYVQMLPVSDAFMNLNSGNLNRRRPDQPHTWPSHWRDAPAPPSSEEKL